MCFTLATDSSPDLMPNTDRISMLRVPDSRSSLEFMNIVATVWTLTVWTDSQVPRIHSHESDRDSPPISRRIFLRYELHSPEEWLQLCSKSANPSAHVAHFQDGAWTSAFQLAAGCVHATDGRTHFDSKQQLKTPAALYSIIGYPCSVVHFRT